MAIDRLSDRITADAALICLSISRSILTEHPPQDAPGDPVISLFQVHKTHVDWLGKLPTPLKHPSKGTTTPVCQSTGIAPDVHTMLQRCVNQDSPTTFRALRYPRRISSTPGAPPSGNCFTTSATSALEIGWSTSWSSDSVPP
ncbi:hypothetical protein D4764_01G0000470 [Takifugu flavidus]|uniref:Uncharacterized protein n=1 Tax=Takifugu flavidus TaxID=433684 RepID=A0A5C6PK36_9TELE|nr:hypothetical protein D4764_01G0000470 [Takifugu flavidus]